MDRSCHGRGHPSGWSLQVFLVALIVGSLVGCVSAPAPYPPAAPVSAPAPVSGALDDAPLPAPIQRGKSRWIPVRWAEVPGWGQDRLHEAWNAWVRGCERPAPGQAALCAEVRQLSLGGPQEQASWVVRRLQPYRVTEPDGAAPAGLLTGYYEPILDASRVPSATHRTPLYAPPAGLRAGQPWYTRQEIETLPAAQAALQGRVIAWLADPIDALLLHIQGSGRLRLATASGTQTVRVAFAVTNNQPYRSVNQWLSQRGVPVTPWPDATKAWARNNPAQLSEMLWSNPRYVFFKEEPLSELDARFGPRGAQGVPLTPGRSIAVDRESIPYGTPVWLATQGPVLNTQRLVMAQDTGSAIVGAVRADFFTGWGPDALGLAAGLKQPLQLWVLWPR
jgi:membrane-bound lytic murein transglycosylase A